jgi:hypothetical protein
MILTDEKNGVDYDLFGLPGRTVSSIDGYVASQSTFVA